MTFLPIVDRELRVAARKRSTFWLRVVAALVTITISAAFLAIGGLMEMQGGMFPLSLGAVLFAILTWMSFGCACFAGVFFTSDTLSEEKREGTLGLLFLTDLRSYDVVLGKLMAMSLRTFYALLAIFPIVGITLLMGGVTGAEFWQRMLVLVNTLFFSLAAGMFVSSISRESQKALGGTLFLILLFVVGLPLIDVWIAYLKKRTFVPLFSYASLWLGCNYVGSASAKMFWWSFAIPNFLGWIFLVLASICTPRAFHEKAAGGAPVKKNWLYSLRFGTDRGRNRRRRRLLEINPALWLAHRQRWRWLLLWIFSFACVALFAFIVAYYWNSKNRGVNYGILIGVNFFFGVVILGLKFWMAAQASRFFIEAWRTGALELLLTSPLPEKKIIRGQWSALARLFFVPVALIVFTQGVFGFLQMDELRGIASGMPPQFFSPKGQFVFTLVSITITLADLTALEWFGMWMGLTTRRPNIAVLKTILFIIAIPWFASLFAQGYLMLLISWASWPFWIPTFIVGGLMIAKDIFFIVWAMRNLHTKFRTVAAGTVKPVWTPKSAPLPHANLPPVIPSPHPPTPVATARQVP